MRISYKRKTDGAYLFQHIGTRELVWLKNRKDEFVLLSLKEDGHVLGDEEVERQLINEMLVHANFPDNIDDVAIVETETIEF